MCNTRENGKELRQTLGTGTDEGLNSKKFCTPCDLWTIFVRGSFF